MFPFWEIAVAPVLEAAGVRNLVEVGALRGDNTRRIIERLGPDAVLHVVDPAPDFDPTEHEQEFAGQYVFHRALSVDVLGELPAMDAALLDGDHNWYTVYNECRLLAAAARRDGRPLPVLVLHDVGWPYGRRDLYYDPATVPAEHRQPHRRAGIRPGRSELLQQGGLNAHHWNAEHEGGPRNGVMTGLEDFMAEHDRPLRRVVLPLYYGLAVVVEEELLAARPALGAALDRLESPEVKEALIELGESIRLRAIVNTHSTQRRKDDRIERLASRYLDGVVRGLVDEYHLENEVRISHLLDAVANGRPPSEGVLRDPVRNAPLLFEDLRTRRRTGAQRPAVPAEPADSTFAPGGRLALDELLGAFDAVRERRTPGDLFVCGAGRGGVGVLARAYLEAHDLDGRQVWVADRFRADEHADLNVVRDAFERFGLLDERVHLLQGDPAATLPDAPPQELALLHLGELGAADAAAALAHLYPRLAVGGAVVVGDTSDPGVATAVEDFRRRAGVREAQTRFAAAGTWWRKAREADPAAAPAAPAGSPHAPLARPATTPVDLSVVIVVHEMGREAERSLHALSRAYQRGIEDLEYEVLVVENGSSPAGRLGEELVRSFGPEFRYLDLGGEARPSPSHALNRGIAESRGDALALMVDGAHVVTPGVLRYGMVGLASYEPAVVATQQWYVGPGQQGEAMRGGYDQSQEDELFERIGWPADGYRLFEIGHFIGERDWLDGMPESNCLFVRRKQLEQVGGFDEGFAMGGGGYTNLELYERLGASPDVQVVTILGEGSFHQVHGGTTTNLPDPAERRERVHGYGEQFRELRGRRYTGPEKPLRYVGSLEHPASRRTRARRMTASAFPVDRAIEGPDGPFGQRAPVPDELRDAFVHAYWRSGAWRATSWLGRPVPNAAADLVVYQQLLADVRPDWIVETGTRTGGRALFLASVCDLLGHGQVVSIDSAPADDLPEHPRITYLRGGAQTPEIVEQVRELVGPEPRALVLLGSRGGRNRVRLEFDAYAPLVPVGSYVVVEHTVLNGRPVDASHGPGPREALRGILADHGEFMVDTDREQQSLTFNPGGFLRRIR